MRIAQCDIGVMASMWPQVTAWPNDLREHATHLSKYLSEALRCIESAKEQPVPTHLVKTLIAAISVVLTKIENAPDHTTVMQALTTIQNDVKIAATAMQTTATMVQQTATISQQVIKISQDTNATTKEVAATGKLTSTLLKETNDIAKAIHSSPVPRSTYASALSSNISQISKPITITTQTPSIIQAQREIIVKITDPVTIENLRAKNPRTLQSHIDRAIEQSKNTHIEKIRVASANQLKSGDLSIKTINITEAEILRQFANDWAPRIGNGASIRTLTYGVIAHGIRTSSMDMEKFDQIKTEILQDNKPFIPTADIKYIGWLSRSAPTKSASSIIIEFTRPEDANKIIDEGLIWQGEAFQCERYDRKCRLKQCYKCQKYGHIGTQCRAPNACGYCAEQHSSRDCPTKADKEVTRKCAMCKGPHEAWNKGCPVRQTEMGKVKSAYDSRQPYHYVPPRAEPRQNSITTFNGTPAEAAMTVGPGCRRPRVNPSLSQGTREERSRSPDKRMPKRINRGNEADGGENDDTVMMEGSQRPQRTIITSRRALEAITPNRQLRPQSSADGP